LCHYARQFHYLSNTWSYIFAVVDKIADQQTNNFDFQQAA
jgi:hypothetical protein